LVGHRRHRTLLFMPELLRMGALAIAARIRKREVSPVEVVEAHIARIEQVNPRLNAVVWSCFDRARDEAKRAEKRTRDLGPLHGVPFTVKEMIALESCPNAAGSWHRRHARATRDATAVARLRAAGAIPLGVTNQPEMGLWTESDNVIYGRANNPWDVSRSPGGSSGGEGAIIAAGGSPFGLGSDAGGSIRLPAFYCGIAGHKPTGAIVPLTGHFPFVVDDDHPSHGPPPRYVVIGPMARSARDLMPLLAIMKGPDGVDAYVERDVELGDPATVDFRGKRVLVLDDPRFRLASRTDPALADAVRNAAKVLEARGAIVEPWSHPLLFEAMAIWRAFFTEGRPEQTAASTFAYGGTFAMQREIIRTVLGRPRHSMSSLAVVLGERLAPKPRGTGETLRRRARAMREELEQKLGPEGVLVLPPHPRVAPRHRTSLLRPLDFAVTAIFNALENPATVVRTGFDRDGLPLGVQIVARRGADHVSIAAAIALEEDLGGFVVASERSGERAPELHR
jgi:fatty acid amide hydrolase 2